MTKKEKIKKLTLEILKDSQKQQIQLIEKALNSGALDIDGWDEHNGSMIIPKVIVAAILEKEATQYYARGCTFEKKIKKEIKNLGYFL